MKTQFTPKQGLALAAGASAALVALLCALAFSGPTPPAPDETAMSAWSAAQQLVEAQHPGAKTFSRFKESVVERAPDGNYLVGLRVDGVNAFNAPVRQDLVVEMRRDGDTWKHVATHRR